MEGEEKTKAPGKGKGGGGLGMMKFFASKHVENEYFF